MTSPRIWPGSITEGQDFYLLARVQTADGTNLVIGDVAATGINVYGYDVTSEDVDTTAVYSQTGIAPGAGGPSDGPIYTTLKTDYNWGDGTGYNFRIKIDLDSHWVTTPVGGHKYRFEVSFDTDGGADEGDIWLLYELQCFPVLSTTT